MSNDLLTPPPPPGAGDFFKAVWRGALVISPGVIFVLWVAIGAINALHTPDPRFGSTSTVLLILDFWALAAALTFAVYVYPGLMRRNIWRVLIAGVALMMMGGRILVSFFIASFFSGHVEALNFFLLAPPILFVFGIVFFSALFVTLMTFVTLFVMPPMLIFITFSSFDQALTQARRHSDGIAAKVAQLIAWITGIALPKPVDDSKGARFATIEEIRKLHNPASATSMGFGHIGNQPLMLENKKHVLVMASTRSGKGVALIIPHLLRYRGSAFVLDPKGENAKATGRHRATLNNQVHYLDPFGISGKPQSRYNPLARFTPDNMEAESKALAAAIFVLSDRDRGDHFSMAGQQLLATFILYVYAAPEIRKDKKDLPTVRRLLLGNVIETLEAMREMYNEADGLLVDLANSFLKTPEKERGSIISTAQRQTEILDNPYIAACLSASGDGPEVDFAAWHKGTMTVYLCLSATKFPTFNRWLRLVLVSALDEMTDTLNPPKLPVCFMLDELATLGHLQSVENAIGLAAGYGIQLVTVFQDVAQMRDLYKGRWASFISNSGVRALFNLDDYDTAEYWSKTMGGRLVESRSRQQDIDGNYKGENVSENLRPLLSPEELMMTFAADRMLILVQGQHPIATSRMPYYDPRSGLAGLWDDPNKPVARRPAAPRQVTAKKADALATAATPQPAQLAPPVQPETQSSAPAPAPKAAPAYTPPLAFRGTITSGNLKSLEGPMRLQDIKEMGKRIAEQEQKPKT